VNPYIYWWELIKGSRSNLSHDAGHPVNEERTALTYWWERGGRKFPSTPKVVSGLTVDRGRAAACPYLLIRS
jgi:hypothetical protein